MTNATRANTGGLQPRFIGDRPDGLPIEAHKRYSLILETSGDDQVAVKAAAFADFIGYENPGLIISRADGQPYPEHKRYSNAIDFTDEKGRMVAAVYAFETTNAELATDILVALDDPANAPAQHRYAS